jgi:hypothetical protein
MSTVICRYLWLRVSVSVSGGENVSVGGPPGLLGRGSHRCYEALRVVGVGGGGGRNLLEQTNLQTKETTTTNH